MHQQNLHMLEGIGQAARAATLSDYAHIVAHYRVGMNADSKDLAQLLNSHFDDRLAMLEGLPVYCRRGEAKPA